MTRNLEFDSFLLSKIQKGNAEAFIAIEQYSLAIFDYRNCAAENIIITKKKKRRKTRTLIPNIGILYSGNVIH